MKKILKNAGIDPGGPKMDSHSELQSDNQSEDYYDEENESGDSASSSYDDEDDSESSEDANEQEQVNVGIK